MQAGAAEDMLDFDMLDVDLSAVAAVEWRPMQLGSRRTAGGGVVKCPHKNEPCEDDGECHCVSESMDGQFRCCAHEACQGRSLIQAPFKNFQRKMGQTTGRHTAPCPRAMG